MFSGSFNSIGVRCLSTAGLEEDDRGSFFSILGLEIAVDSSIFWSVKTQQWLFQYFGIRDRSEAIISDTAQALLS